MLGLAVGLWLTEKISSAGGIETAGFTGVRVES